MYKNEFLFFNGKNKMRFKLESFPKEIIEKITNELSLTALINLRHSQLSSNIEKIYKTNDFWFHRFFNEFSFLIPQFPDLKYRAKCRYFSIHFKISDHSKDLVEAFLQVLGKFSENLKDDYREKLYWHIYNRNAKLLEHLVKNQKYIDDEDNFTEEFFEFSYLDGFDNIFPMEMRDDQFWFDFQIENIEDFALSFTKYLRIIPYDEYDSDSEGCFCEV